MAKIYSKRAARIDTTQRAIVRRLRECGVAVEIIGYPLDLLVCCRGETFLLEVKSGNGSLTTISDAQVTQRQREFIARWPGRWHFVRSPDEAVRAVLGEQLYA
jgi:hypothetical protein